MYLMEIQTTEGRPKSLKIKFSKSCVAGDFVELTARRYRSITSLTETA